MTAADDADDFAVDGATHYLGALAERFPEAMKRLGRLETHLLRDRLPPVRQPVYVAGLARAGSTLLLELLAALPGVATHRYRDFPLIHIPYLWNRFLDYAGTRDRAPRERAHRDGIRVTRESPEAFEEVVWMAFFPHLHDPDRCNVLTDATSNPGFEAFYRDHVRKLLLTRAGTRYVAKGNYNVSRFEYLLKLFPDARFVVPVREPIGHVASLVKQQRLFLEGQRREPRARDHLSRAGHFEFGVDRRPVHVGDADALAAVEDDWEQGREASGWARYWSMIYGHLAERLCARPALASATLLLPFEALCREPAAVIRLVCEHCGLAAEPKVLEQARQRVRAPTYYTPDFSDSERAAIAALTDGTRARLQELVAAAQPTLAVLSVEGAAPNVAGQQHSDLSR